MLPSDRYREINCNNYKVTRTYSKCFECKNVKEDYVHLMTFCSLFKNCEFCSIKDVDLHYDCVEDKGDKITLMEQLTGDSNLCQLCISKNVLQHNVSIVEIQETENVTDALKEERLNRRRMRERKRIFIALKQIGFIQEN